MTISNEVVSISPSEVLGATFTQPWDWHSSFTYRLNKSKSKHRDGINIPPVIRMAQMHPGRSSCVTTTVWPSKAGNMRGQPLIDVCVHFNRYSGTVLHTHTPFSPHTHTHMVCYPPPHTHTHLYTLIHANRFNTQTHTSSHCVKHCPMSSLVLSNAKRPRTLFITSATAC